HFEIPADDVERAKAFYQKTFGWGFNEYKMPGADSYWLIQTVEVDKNMMPKEPGAINGGMMKRHMPQQSFTNYIQVDSIDEMLKTIIANGGTLIVPKQEIDKDMGWLAAFKDTEGNIMGLIEMTKEQKTKNKK
ncbi:MAG: VOC family protein, partial [bacterium]|nr:VOC family protein [bacterium]